VSAFRMIARTLVPDRAIAALIRLRYARARSLSQIGQDFWVFGEAFNGARSRYFVDIGAADGITESNTYLLEKRFGWSGICVEPDPRSYAKLARNRSCVCLNACADAAEGEVDFVFMGRHGGIVDSDTDNKPDGTTTSGYVRLRTRRLEDILREQGSPRVIDYLSIDVEGAEDRVLGAFPFAEYRFNCLTVERPGTSLRAILDENGYILLRQIPRLDCFYIHTDFLGEFVRNMFGYWESNRKSLRLFR
jgi:FkbM family methyltransferase